MTDIKKTVVVYDDKCRTCSVARSAADSLDADVDFVGMHSARGKQLIEEHGFDMEESAYAIRADGSIAKKSDMVISTLESTNIIGRFFARSLRILPPSYRDRIYEFASRHRYRGY